MAELWTPPGADLGYNMPGGEAPPQTPPGQPGPAQPGGFWNKVQQGLGSTLQERAKQNAAKTPDETWGGKTKPGTQIFLQAFDPADKPGQTEGRWAAAKWAFRGTRTTNSYSAATEQNLYGGVQRNEIPTARISTWGTGKETPGQSRAEQRRAVLNEQELAWSGSTPPPGGEGGAGGAPMGLPPGTGYDPATMARPGVGAPASFGAAEDPLFAKNTGSMPFNAMQFGNLHQRQVAGGQ